MTTQATVTFTGDGSLHMTADVAATYFPSDSLVAMRRNNELWLLPLTGPEGGGLLLKQLNRQGDRATVIWEHLPAEPPVGDRTAVWDADAGALRVALGTPEPLASPADGRSVCTISPLVSAPGRPSPNPQGSSGSTKASASGAAAPGALANDLTPHESQLNSAPTDGPSSARRPSAPAPFVFHHLTKETR